MNRPILHRNVVTLAQYEQSLREQAMAERHQLEIEDEPVTKGILGIYGLLALVPWVVLFFIWAKSL